MTSKDYSSHAAKPPCMGSKMQSWRNEAFWGPEDCGRVPNLKAEIFYTAKVWFHFYLIMTVLWFFLLEIRKYLTCYFDLTEAHS